MRRIGVSGSIATSDRGAPHAQFLSVRPMTRASGDDFLVIAAQYGLDSLAGNVAAVKSALARVSSPTILVGHSYGGTLITAAGVDPRAAGLVYIAALAPDITKPAEQVPPLSDVRISVDHLRDRTDQSSDISR
jgi:pimeloyl-ACP methyl ester carboxylesterase